MSLSRVLYYCPDHPSPSGGTKTLYRHVDLLRGMGIDAAILHNKPGFRCSWFVNTTPVVYTPDTGLDSDTDLLVLPEVLGPQTVALAGPVPKVIFNQNTHYTWRGYSIPPVEPTPYTDPHVRGSLVLTEYDEKVLRWAFPKHPVFVVPHGIDPVLFPLGESKRKQIAYMPRKHPEEARQVLGWLWARGALKGWEVVAIDGLSEADTSQVLQESLVFMAFGYPEGGTLPPFEAMATGCVVVGYGGHASDVDLAVCGGRLVPSSDTTEFAIQAEKVLKWPVEKLVAWGRDSAEMVAREFPPEREREALRGAMEVLLG